MEKTDSLVINSPYCQFAFRVVFCWLQLNKNILKTIPFSSQGQEERGDIIENSKQYFLFNSKHIEKDLVTVYLK